MPSGPTASNSVSRPRFPRWASAVAAGPTPRPTVPRPTLRLRPPATRKTKPSTS